MTEMQVKERRRSQRLLEKSGRITPREVLEAYEETGLIPVSDCFLDGDKACGVGVLMARDKVEKGWYGFELSALEGWHREREANLSRHYTCGFFYGFDGEPLSSYLDKKNLGRKGYRDGQRARRFVFGA